MLPVFHMALRDKRGPSGSARLEHLLPGIMMRAEFRLSGYRSGWRRTIYGAIKEGGGLLQKQFTALSAPRNSDAFKGALESKAVFHAALFSRMRKRRCRLHDAPTPISSAERTRQVLERG